MDEFKLNFKVRDYECDIQGIVNNAVYLNYLEHSRHEFLKAIDIDFKDMHEQGLDLVVTEANYKYISPLKSNDEFYTSLKFEMRSKVRFCFVQSIYKVDGEKVLEAEVTGTCIDRNKNKAVTVEKLANIS